MEKQGLVNEKELWKRAFDILLSKGDVYMYDYDAAIKCLSEKGFNISLDAEKDVTFCEMCVKHEFCADKGFCIRMNPI